jgi:hypothetical protein
MPGPIKIYRSFNATKIPNAALVESAQALFGW